MVPFADIVFHNGKILTMDANHHVASAIAIKNNQIVYVGNEGGLSQWTGSATQRFDLKGRCLLPGFIDSHAHLGGRGLNETVILDCSIAKVGSIRELVQKIKEAADQTPEGSWIKATGYDQNKLAERRHPTKEDLDEAAPNHPVQLTRCCMHMGVYNTQALSLGDIKSPDQFAEGEVDVDQNGRITGLLKEGACTYMWDKVIFSKEEYMQSFQAANDLFIKNGITSVHDAGLYGDETMGYFQEACEQGIIKLRVYSLLYNTYGKERTKKWLEHFLQTGIHTGLGTERFKIGAAKILLDGSSSGPSCATRMPYSHDPDAKGILLWTQEETDQMIQKLHNAGFQVTAHALGDAAVEMMIHAIEKALKENPRPHRHRIEHCGLVDKAFIERIKASGIIPISNPGFFYINAAAYKRFYGQRTDFMFPLQSYLQEGIPTALGSDTPVISVNPLLGVYSAMERKDGKTDCVIGEKQKISLMDALKMYTYNGAFASMEEDIKGSLEPGKLADLIVLSNDITQIEPIELLNTKVDLTMIDGEIVYESKS